MSSNLVNLDISKDINLDVTDTVKIWYTSSKGVSGPTGRVDVANEGFILKWSSLDQPGGGIKRQDIEFNEDISMYEDLFSNGQRVFHGVLLDDEGNLIKDNQEPENNCLEDFLLKQRN